MNATNIITARRNGTSVSITIPKNIRKILNIEEGQNFLFSINTNQEIIIKKIDVEEMLSIYREVKKEENNVL